jgi:hypothetical protein
VLHRPPAPPSADPAEVQRQRRRAQRCRWQGDWRRRQRDGAVLAEVSSAMIELLISGRWLEPDKATNKIAIKDALDAMAKASLRNFR